MSTVRWAPPPPPKQKGERYVMHMSDGLGSVWLSWDATASGWGMINLR